MMFASRVLKFMQRAALWAALPAVLCAGPAFADGLGYAVVPTQIIYPGDEIQPSQLQMVEVTNPDLAGGYAQDVNEVKGMVSTRTLLPGRTIMVATLRLPYTVKRGEKILLIYDQGGLKITASGTPLDNAITGELIRARNTDTGVIISGTVMQDGSVLVEQK
jgi:flagellar basal body P-ring formation protein FlgA